MIKSKSSKFNLWFRIVVLALLLTIIILIAQFHKSQNQPSDRPQVNFYFPWGLVSIFISFYIFYEYNRVRKAKRKERQEYLNEHRQELLNNIFKNKAGGSEKKDNF